MRNPASPMARRAGFRIKQTSSSNIPPYATPDSVPQRLLRRKPNAPFADNLIGGPELEGLSVGVAGGADRRLLDLIEEVAG
jgi:hypothetical protein